MQAPLSLQLLPLKKLKALDFSHFEANYVTSLSFLELQYFSSNFSQLFGRHTYILKCRGRLEKSKRLSPPMFQGPAHTKTGEKKFPTPSNTYFTIEV